MNYYIILLIVIVLILLYYLYINYVASSNVLTPIVNLNNKSIEIKYDDLSKKDSTRYSYGLWIYVNSWTSTDEKILMVRGDINNPDFCLKLDQTSPVLRCIIKPSNSASNAQSANIVITDNFPIQKWTYVVVSVDNQIIDFYLDGKLVLSRKINFMPIISSNSIILGNDSKKNDIFLANVIRTPNPMDPQTAWNTYLNGNGQPNNSNVNLKLSVLQNNVEQKKFTLF